LLSPRKRKDVSEYSEHVPGEILYRVNGEAECL
jgi:hypothetical protein